MQRLKWFVSSLLWRTPPILLKQQSSVLKRKRFGITAINFDENISKMFSLPGTALSSVTEKHKAVCLSFLRCCHMWSDEIIAPKARWKENKVVLVCLPVYFRFCGGFGCLCLFVLLCNVWVLSKIRIANRHVARGILPKNHFQMVKRIVLMRFNFHPNNHTLLKT